MRSGYLRHRATIQQKSVTRSATGAEVVTWSTVATVWAAINPMRGAEYVDAAQLRDQVDAKITMRYRSGIIPAMRVTEGGNTWDIISVVNPGQRDALLELMCKAVT
jgi:SPP1 family predicted phage head-tail adaptor